MDEMMIIEAENEMRVAEDYSALRKEGIQLIEKLAGKVWTDFNAHDPGITILEAICYALTDLAYRTSFPIKNLLASNEPATSGFNALYTGREILTSGPVTLTDYRKLVIDTEGVRNAWIETSSDYEIILYAVAGQEANKPTLTYDIDSGGQPLRLRGLYKVIVEYEPAIIQNDRQQEVAAHIKKKLRAHRNLCEDVISISSVEYEPFTMEADLQVQEGADIEKIHARVLHIVQNFFSPAIPFYTFEQMQARGYSAEEIFEGPALKHGFIDNRQLESSEQSPDIHLSDIVNRISKIEGVIAVKRCWFPVGSQSPFSEFAEWIREQTMSTDKIFRLDIDNSPIRFTRSGDKYRDLKKISTDIKKVKALFNFLQSEKGAGRLKDPELDFAPVAGEDMNVEDYYPFQYNLPAAYGLNEGNTEGELTPKKINALQLKGYLMVFEQIMADYLAQLAGIKTFFSFDPNLPRTYYSQALHSISDARLLFKDHKKYIANTGWQENEMALFQRRNALLDHLLARFGEEMGSFSFYSQNAGQPLPESLNAKADFLREYICISNYRFGGFNYAQTGATWETDNVSGAKKRICRMMGIRNYSRRNMTSDWIKLLKKEEANGLVRYVAQILDPQTKELLLESNPYPTESEARYVMSHILSKGYDRKAYETVRHAGKFSYKLKMENQEGGLDIVAAGNPLDEKKLNGDLERLLAMLDSFAKDENFHVLEHILLRPKIDPHPAGQEEKGISSSAVSLMELKDVPEGVLQTDSEQPAFPYRFKIESKTGTASFVTWKLSLVKDKRNAVLAIDEIFPLKKNAHERMLRIREAGADHGNYREEKVNDGYHSFSIVVNGRKLAASIKKYKEKADMDEEIKMLVGFFAFELNLMTPKEDEEEVFIADIIDPYSFQVSIYLPDWPERFRDPSFRHMLENTIHSEIPAHIYPNIYWLDYKMMKDFEEVYKPWLNEMAANAIPDTGIVNNLLFVVNEIRKMN